MKKITVTNNVRDRQGELGQFLTAPHVADFMSSMFENLPEAVRLLDAGAGAGALTVAFVSRCCEGEESVREINATLYEKDPAILGRLRVAMRDCERACSCAGIKFSYDIRATDFIQEVSAGLSGDLFGVAPSAYDVAIVNPPYRKIRSDSMERRALRSAGIETTNLYTGFVALIQRLLVPHGQLVGIVPRSFCNGPYFRSFREEFLKHLELRRLHVFDSRNAVFRQDSVLQENVIFHVSKGGIQPAEILVSSSSGENGEPVSQSRVPFGEIVHPADSEQFIHIPAVADHSIAREVMGRLDSSLGSLGIAVSTGRVVDFRLKESLRKEPEQGSVPLLYPCHFNGGTIHWPKMQARKPNAIMDNDNTRPWLVPSGLYLLTKRFTSKEEPRRLVACIYDPEQVESDWVGFENHLNYFHANGQGLERNLAAGLFAFLNSTVIDQYFRRFSGHTQVNATDLRTLRYPNGNVLRAIGQEMTTFNLAQGEIDSLITRYLDGLQ